MNITAKDIAKNLGISTSAVSLAMNGKPGVSVATREKVLAEAIRMGYYIKKESEIANQNIRYVIFLEGGATVQETSFYSIVLQGIEITAKKHGYNVLISYFNSKQSWTEQIAAVTKDVSGLIVLGTEVEDRHIYTAIQNGLGKINLPLVMVDNATSIINIDSVVADNLRGAYHAVTFLLNKGHKDVGYLRSTSRIDSFDERQLGYLKARKEHGLSDADIPPVIDVGISSEHAYYDMCNWLDAGNRPCTAFFAENDIIAAACIRALKSHGFQVPQDVSVVGFDDMPLCTMVDPPLTTIRIMKEEMGMAAMEILHHRIQQGTHALNDNRIGVYRVAISTHLVERNSTRQLKAANSGSDLRVSH